MKRKSIFLLGTILAGAALVGGTFAAWAVTDNASPFNVKITPGTLDVGENKAVTLEWGTKGLVDIQELALGEERGPYVVGLKATTSDSSGFTGNLALCLSTTSAASEKLINYLDVKVYNGVEKGLKPKEQEQDPDVYNDPILSILYNDDEDETPVGEGATASKSKNLDIDVTSGVEQKVSFYIRLKEGINPITYNTIKDQVVNLTVDWNKGSQIVPVTSKTIYADYPSGWNGTPLYAYAYRSTDGKSSTDWPGQAMTNVKLGIWSVAIENEYDTVIFNDGNYDSEHGTGGHQVPAKDKPGFTISTAKPYYHYDSELTTEDKWVWTTAPDISAEVNYFFGSSKTGWDMNDTYKLTKLETAATFDGHEYTYALKSGADLVAISATSETGNVGAKVFGDNNTWYNEYGLDGGNAFLIEGETYNVYFNPTPEEGGQYLYLKCTTRTFNTYNLDLVGNLEENNNWASENASIFVHYWKTVGEDTTADNYKLSDYTHFKVPNDVTGFLLVRADSNVASIVWRGETGFFNQSENQTLPSGTQKTLKVTGWGSDEPPLSTFEWVA